MSEALPLRLLCVVNKQLPDSDYRLAHDRMSGQVEAVFAMPGRPEGLDPHRWVRLPVGEGMALSDVSAVWRLHRYLRRHRDQFDLVHFYSTKLILVGPPLARLAGLPSAITVTGLGRTFDDRRLRYRILRVVYRMLMSQAVRSAELTLFQNRGHLSLFQEWFPKHRHRFQLIGSATAVTSASARALRSYEDRPLQALCVARLLPTKGIDDFLEVARQLQGPRFQFVLVGPGSTGEDEIYERVVAAADQGTIQYLGQLEAAPLHDVYRRSHILLFPSIGEGMSRVMLEAGMFGLCPVAYAIDANRDLVVAGGGILVPVGERRALSRAVEELNADRGRLASEASAFRTRVQADYDLEGFVDRYDRAIYSAAGRPDICADGTLSAVRQASTIDLPGIAKVHSAAFPDSFLTSLGPAFLRSYYRSVLKSRAGILLVAVTTSGQVVGLVAGSVGPSQFYRHLVRRPLRPGVAVLQRLLRRPTLVGASIDGLLRVIRNGREESVELVADAELASIAVEPHSAGRGLGRALLDRFEDEVLALGGRSMSLTADRDGNGAVNRFYEAQGFALVGSTTRDGGRLMSIYHRECP